mmetsp:Transcript_62101/g.148118  ORF Transcript_62101/g.148118 Transcript_62101/m.148118 type:complete len:342 (-) Transcript_62101:232-1257(-)
MLPAKRPADEYPRSCGFGNAWYAYAPGKRIHKRSVDRNTLMHLDAKEKFFYSHGEAARNLEAIAIKAVQENGLALEYVGPDMLKNRDVVLAAVRQNGLALRFADEVFKNDNHVVETAISNNGRALKSASENLRSCRRIVEMAIKQDGGALDAASDELKKDRQLVHLALRNGGALIYADTELRSDRELATFAVDQDWERFDHAGDDLLMDETFAPEARVGFWIFKITMMSGNSVVIPWRIGDEPDTIRRAVKNLAIADLDNKVAWDVECGGTALLELYHGSERVPSRRTAKGVQDWPGNPQPGKVVEYQLIVKPRETDDEFDSDDSTYEGSDEEPLEGVQPG